MADVFCILGYGIPENIATDENYGLYLKSAFNRIFAVAEGKSARIMVSGGKTDCVPPFTRTEAGEMARFFCALLHRPAVAALTKKWKVEREMKSISTLENLLFLKKMVKPGDRVTVICEWSRVGRVSALAKKIFKKKVAVWGIDFDQSINRYHGKKVLAAKERKVLKQELASLASAAALKAHHKAIEDKIAFCRAAYGKMSHAEAVKKYWEMTVMKKTA